MDSDRLVIYRELVVLDNTNLTKIKVYFAKPRTARSAETYSVS